jgi:hypothetical protein
MNDGEDFTDNEEEEIIECLPFNQTYNENGALAVSLEGMTVAEATPLPPDASLTRQILTEKARDDDELWGCIVALNTGACRKTDAITNWAKYFPLQRYGGPLLAKIEDPLARIEFYRWILYNRDISEGKGEREISYFFLYEALIRGYGEEVKKILRLFPTGFGYWGDLTGMYNWICENKIEDSRDKEFKTWIAQTLMFQTLQDQRTLIEHKNLLASGQTHAKPSISLVGKWLPTEGKAKDANGLAKTLATLMYPGKGSEARYRKTVSMLRAHLQVVETKMSADKWGDIEPSSVPAKAMKKYRKVFMNSKGKVDAGRLLLARKLSDLLGGKTDKVIKTKGLQFYELIKPYVEGRPLDEVIECQAKTIIQNMALLVQNGSFPIAVPLSDVSGSMSGTPLIVSIALGLLLANIMPAPWKGQVITFESKPRWVSLPTDESIFKQVRILRDSPWGGSTNFTAAVEMVLQRALTVENVRDVVPEFLFCFTDMQFDQADDRNAFVIDNLKRLFANNGLVMPNVVLWNLRSTETTSFAADKNTPGVGIISGFSQAVFKAFMDGCNFERLTPISLMKDILHAKRYDVVDSVMA